MTATRFNFTLIDNTLDHQIRFYQDKKLGLSGLGVAATCVCVLRGRKNLIAAAASTAAFDGRCITSNADAWTLYQQHLEETA